MPWMKSLVAFAVLGVLFGAPPVVRAQADDTPSIMKDEAPVPQKKRAVRRGSSSPSPVPPYQSTVRPPGVAPRIIEPYAIDRSASPSQIVPGVLGAAGPAVTPPRPAGQSFPDRALSCLHSGASQGVNAGQIGAYTGACVNQ